MSRIDAVDDRKRRKSITQTGLIMTKKIITDPLVRGSWKRVGVQLAPDLRLHSQQTEQISEAEHAAILDQNAPVGPEDGANARLLISALCRPAVEVLAKAGYPSKPGLYRRTKTGRWMQIQVEEALRPVRDEGVLSPTFRWPNFDNIEELTLEDFARRLICAVEDYLDVFDKDGGRAALTAMAHEVILAYASFRAERSGMAADAFSGLKAREGAVSGGKERGNKYGGEIGRAHV